METVKRKIMNTVLKNILFVCKGNEQRSPSFEDWTRCYRPQYNVKSTGTHHSQHESLSIELLTWADKVFVMDLEQEIFISVNFPIFINKVKVIGCSDDYGRNSAEICNVIEYWAKKRKF